MCVSFEVSNVTESLYPMLVLSDLIIFDESHGLVVSQYGRTPLHVAAENNSFDVAELLIRYGANVNARDKVSTVIIQT